MIHYKRKKRKITKKVQGEVSFRPAPLHCTYSNDCQNGRQKYGSVRTWGKSVLWVTFVIGQNRSSLPVSASSAEYRAHEREFTEPLSNKPFSSKYQAHDNDWFVARYAG